MKTKHIALFLISIATYLFSSCEKEIGFSGEITKPMLVLNSIITPDSVIKVHLSESKFFLEDNASYKDVENAEVTVWFNDVNKEKLTYNGKGVYTASFKPKTGETIKITAKKAGFAEVSSMTTVVPSIQILSVDTLNHRWSETPMIQVGSYDGNGSINDTVGVTRIETYDLEVKFSDPQTVNNFYKINVIPLNYNDSGTVINYHTTANYTDVVFGNKANDPFESGMHSYENEFSDELFNGQTYRLKLSVSTNYYYFYEDYIMPGKVKKENPIRKQEIIIELQSISDSYFQYIRSKSASRNTDPLFSEPVQIYNNIKNGIGILGNYSSSFFKIQLK